MGRKSTRENKNIYQLSRENAGLTREAAAEGLVFLSADRIEKIESGRSAPHPDEVQAMAVCYRDASLCNRFCATECAIGAQRVSLLTEKELPGITLELLDAMNCLQEESAKLIRISKDGKVSPEELVEFAAIHRKVCELGDCISSYRLWLENELLRGGIDEEGLREATGE